MKKAIILATILMISIITGCEDNSNVSTTKAFIGGNDGLTINFEENQPPAEVLDDEQETFGITLRLENEGEADIPRGEAIATISGIEVAAFGLSSLTAVNDHDISGMDLQEGEELQGDIESIDLGDATYKYKLDGDFETTIKAEICYNYETDAVFSLCLKKNTVQKQSDEDICDIDESKDVENSGAPVHISNVKESRGGNNEVKFMFNIDKMGSGTVFAPDAFNSQTGCTENDDKKNEVVVAIEPQSDIAVSCTRLNGAAQGSIKLYDGRGTVVCEIDTGSVQDTAFETPIKVKVMYMYRDSLNQDIVIKKS